jgi:hypothetical protein
VTQHSGRVGQSDLSDRDLTLCVVEGTGPTEPAWADRVCCVPRDFLGDQTIIGLFREASPDLSDRQRFIELVSSYLNLHQELIETWQNYSYDKRLSPSPYLDRTEVGFYSGGHRNVQHYEKTLDAGADFMHREATWVLERRIAD